MTVQYAIFDRLPTGVTLTGKAFDTADPDTEVTGNSFAITEGTNAKGRFTVAITRVSALPASDYDIRLFLGSAVLAVGRFRFAGTDGETATELDFVIQDQLDAIQSTLSAVGTSAVTVTRSTADEHAITFAWPVSGATITGTRSINNGSYTDVEGAIAFLRTETGKHYYTLAYDSADRPAAEGQVRYKFVDGTYTGYVVVRIVSNIAELSAAYDAAKTAATQTSVDAVAAAVEAALLTMNVQVEAY